MNTVTGLYAIFKAVCWPSAGRTFKNRRLPHEGKEPLGSSERGPIKYLETAGLVEVATNVTNVIDVNQWIQKE